MLSSCNRGARQGQIRLSSANMTITPERLRARSDAIRSGRSPNSLGLRLDEALVAKHLPTRLDQVSPHGKLQKV